MAPTSRRGHAESGGRRPAGPGSGRTTVVLVVVLLLLVAVAAGETWYLWLRDEPTASASRPVVTGRLAHQAAVAAASSATEEILSRSYKDFDGQVDRATSKMTGSYAEEYRSRVDGIRADFVRAKTELRVVVRASGVVRASSQQVEALLFLDQYVRKAGRGTTTTPYRALVTVVHTEHGWLVSDIETQ
jgi:Mce-associated membrane protein